MARPRCVQSTVEFDEPLQGIMPPVPPDKAIVAVPALEAEAQLVPVGQSFHRDHTSIARGQSAGSLQICEDRFFRIIDAIKNYISYLTIQGDRLRTGHFTIQEFLGFRLNGQQVGIGAGDVLIATKGAPTLANFSHVSLRDLLANLGFWRVVKTEYAASPDTPLEEGRLMVEMARRRAVQGIVNQRTFVDILPSDAMQKLLGDQRACEVSGVPGHYLLTEKGLGGLILQQEISFCGSALTFDRGCADGLKDKTKWELMLHLARIGWQDEEVGGKVDPYVRGGAKVYYTKPYGSRMPHPYLVCLCLAEELLEKGLHELVHFQSNAYYNMLQFLLESHPHHLADLLPNQCRQYYLDFKHRAEHGTLRPSRRRDVQQSRSDGPGSGQRPLMLEEDDGLDGVRPQSSNTVSRGRGGRGRGSGRLGRGNSAGSAAGVVKRARIETILDSVSDSDWEVADADDVEVEVGSSMEAKMAEPEPELETAEQEKAVDEVFSAGGEKAAASSQAMQVQPAGGDASSSSHNPAVRAHVASRLRQHRRPLPLPPAARRVVERTQVLSDTTVFFGDLAIVKRSDQGVSWLSWLQHACG